MRITINSFSNNFLRNLISNNDFANSSRKHKSNLSCFDLFITIGHAVESLTNYQEFVHGEAVAIGMVAAGKIAMNMGLWNAEEAQRQDTLIRKTGLPTEIPSNLELNNILKTLQSDKKVKAGKVRFVLPTTIGKVIITDKVTEEIIGKAI